MGFKLVSAVVMVALALSGPLAWAQEQQKTEGQMAPAPYKEGGAWRIAAVVATAVNIPGRAVLCGASAVTGIAVLVASFGSGGRWAGRVWEEGCSGPWIISAADMSGSEEEARHKMWMESEESER